MLKWAVVQMSDVLFKETCRVTGSTSLFIDYREQTQLTRFKEIQLIWLAYQAANTITHDRFGSIAREYSSLYNQAAKIDKLQNESVFI